MPKKEFKLNEIYLSGLNVLNSEGRVIAQVSSDLVAPKAVAKYIVKAVNDYIETKNALIALVSGVKTGLDNKTITSEPDGYGNALQVIKKYE